MQTLILRESELRLRYRHLQQQEGPILAAAAWGICPKTGENYAKGYRITQGEERIAATLPRRAASLLGLSRRWDTQSVEWVYYETPPGSPMRWPSRPRLLPRDHLRAEAAVLVARLRTIADELGVHFETLIR